MLRGRITRIFYALLVVAMIAIQPGGARAESAEDIAALNKQVGKLWDERKYQEALPVAERALALAERTLGETHAETITALDNLAPLLRALSRYEEAERYYKRAIAVKEQALGKDDDDTLDSVHALGVLYFTRGRYKEAEPLYLRALEGRERTLGKEHAKTLTSVASLASLWESQGRYGEAEPLLKQVLEAQERTLGQEHTATLISLNNLAQHYVDQGRYKDAEPLFLRALEIKERTLGKEHTSTLIGLNNLAHLYSAQGRYGEAESLYKRALEARERTLGLDHPDTLTNVNNLANLYLAQGRHSEAGALFRRALEARERTLGREHPNTFTSVNNLAHLYSAQGRYGDAEPLYKRALEGYERTLGLEHPNTLTSVNNLAAIYDEQGRYSEAEPLHKRVLEARERTLGRDHPGTLTSVNNLSQFYQRQRRFGEAEPLLKRALEGYERTLGLEHPNTLISVANLADFSYAQGRYDEEEPLLKRVLEARERTLGAEHPDTLASVSNLGELRFAQGRLDEAELLLKRALKARERLFGEEHPATLTNLNRTAGLYFVRHDWAHAVDHWRRSTNAILRLGRHSDGRDETLLIGKQKSETEKWGWHFRQLVKALSRLPGASTAELRRESFVTAQWGLDSEAAQSLREMAARSAKGPQKIAVIVRERQDLVAEWQKRDALRNAELGKAPGKRDAVGHQQNLTRLTHIDERIAEIDKRLKVDFPDYAALASPASLTIEEVQAQLHSNEALALFFDTSKFGPAPEESFLWLVTKTQARWVRLDLGTEGLTREVAALRCGLDAAAWAETHCASLTGKSYTAADAARNRPLPFDAARAHQLYKTLFGKVEDLIKGKQLLLVPSGPLTQLPFQVLVTAPAPANDNYKSIAWLARKHALTVLPAVSSLTSLRRVARPSAATKPLIGFGDPLLNGPDGRYAKLAQLARDKQRCPAPTTLQIASANTGTAMSASPVVIRSRHIELVDIRRQSPLPETADELCAVARDIGADVEEIRLGAHATEREVKRLSESGKLAQYRILHFATHGAMAGELSSTEPGLLLTPPSQPSEEDDGYLSASEIASLKLDADWVILSACNTAAGGAPNAQALSGLARAFIYAQARTLLVSHWAVDSNATVKLVTGIMREIARNKTIDRSEALRRAMVALIDKGAPRETHPAYWAPFIVVGEGGH